ncbi:NAD(+)/NADH kinase [Eubacteriales bacterium OttesenSCG-928-N14]|nr:NAD(+)/NADH kinase [Eubacteriales bacterium OttesenSCG-928-N14]
MKQAFLFVNESRDTDLTAAKALVGHLDNSGFSCFAGEQLADKLGCTVVRTEDIGKMDVAFVVGGDGTMLSAVHLLSPVGVPMLGINLGTVGYLTEVDKSGIHQAVQAIANGQYEIDNRTLLYGKVEEESGGLCGEGVALNEVFISSRTHYTVCRLHVFVGGKFVGEYAADGIIVSTPTGSTAYSLSAGGPILSPDAGCVVITPVCAHTLKARPIVVSDNNNITVRPVKQEQRPLAIGFDGNRTLPFEQGQVLCVQKSDLTAKFIRIQEFDFYGLVQQKLLR